MKFVKISLDTLDYKTGHQIKAKPEMYCSDIEFHNPCFLWDTLYTNLYVLYFCTTVQICVFSYNFMFVLLGHGILSQGSTKVEHEIVNQKLLVDLLWCHKKYSFVSLEIFSNVLFCCPNFKKISFWLQIYLNINLIKKQPWSLTYNLA